MAVTAGRYRALLISNSRFPIDRSLASLEGPPNDVTELRAALTDPAWGLFDPADVRLLPERGQAELREEMETFFADARPADTLLLYYSGHGRIDNLNKLYLCANDTVTSRLLATAISSTFIDDLIERSKTGSTIIVLDCCHSGAYRGDTFGEALAARGRFVLASCRGNELADDVTERNRASHFTDHLASALRGRSAGDADDLTVAMVFNHVKFALGDRPQHPRLFVTGEGSPVIARRRSEKAPPPAAPILSVSHTEIVLRDLIVDEAVVERVYIRAGGADPAAWSVETDTPWVELTRAAEYVELRATPPAGSNRARIYVRDTGTNAVVTVRLLLIVAAPPKAPDSPQKVPGFGPPATEVSAYANVADRGLDTWSETDIWATVSARARSIAADSHHAVLGTAHILFGLYWTGFSASRLLKAHEDLGRIRRVFDELHPPTGRGNGAVRVDDDVVLAIVRMTQLALQRPALGDDQSTCLLIALLQQRGGDAYRLLGRLGIDIAQLRASAWKMIGPARAYGHSISFADALVVALAGEQIRSGVFARFPKAGVTPQAGGHGEDGSKDPVMLRMAMSTPTNFLLLTGRAIYHRDGSGAGPAVTRVAFDDLMSRTPGRWHGEPDVLDLGDGTPHYLEGAPRGAVDAVLAVLGGIHECDALRRRHGAEAPLERPKQRLNLAVRATLTISPKPIFGLAPAPDGSWVAAAGEDTTIRIWDIATESIRATLTGHTKAVYSVAVAPDGSWLVSAGEDATVRIWDAASGTIQATLTGHTKAVFDVTVSPDGTWFASGGEDNTVRIWDVVSRTVRATLSGHTAAVVAVAISPDGTWLASTSHDATVRIWDVASRTVRATLSGHTRYAFGLAVAPDGSWLASAGHENAVRIWDVASLTTRSTLTGHTEYPFAVAVAPDGFWLASAGKDTTIQIWDATSGTAHATLSGHTGMVRGVAFGPDGSWLASAGEDGTVRIWGEVIE